MKRTQFAQQGLDFVTLFAAKFAQVKVGGYRPLLREPIADSTGGGKQALQHMVLEPQIDGDPVLTVGSVNVVTKTARLRTHDCVRQLFAMRFGDKRFLLEQGAYQAFFDKALEFMKRQGMQIDVETRPTNAPSSSLAPPPKAASLVVWAFVIMFTVFAVAIVLLVLTRRIAF